VEPAKVLVPEITLRGCGWSLSQVDGHSVSAVAHRLEYDGVDAVADQARGTVTEREAAAAAVGAAEELEVVVLREELQQHSAIPAERFDIRFECDDAMLRESAWAVLFFQVDRWDATANSLRTLTQVLQEADPEELLKLYYVDVPTRRRPAAFRHESHGQSWHYIGQEEPQTFWVHRGKVMGRRNARGKTASLGDTRLHWSRPRRQP